MCLRALLTMAATYGLPCLLASMVVLTSSATIRGVSRQVVLFPLHPAQ